MLCRTGKHDWISPVGAARCCDPHWRRELRIGYTEPGDDPEGIADVSGESLLFVWRWCGPSGPSGAEAVSHHRGAAPAAADSTG